MDYRRAFVPGGSFFFTAVTESRRPVFSTPENVAVLREAMRRVKAKHPLAIVATVILPDHLHAIWNLPPGDADFSTRWRLVKTWFTKHCDREKVPSECFLSPASALDVPGVRSRLAKAEQAVWQHRYWEHWLRDERDFARHLDYLHYNPVKHGWVCHPIDWPYSSFRHFVKRGIYTEDWGSSLSPDLDGTEEYAELDK